MPLALGKRPRQHFKFGLARHDRRVEGAMQPWRFRIHVLQPPRQQRGRLAFYRDRWNRIRNNSITNQPVGGLTEEDLSWCRALLEPCRDIDGISRGEPLVQWGFPSDYLAGVDTDATRDRDPPARPELFVEVAERIAHLGCRPDRAQSVVLMQLGHTEDGHYRVPDELLNQAAVPADDPAHLIEVERHNPPDRLGVQGLAQCGELHDIGEDNGDGLTHLRLA